LNVPLAGEAPTKTCAGIHALASAQSVGPCGVDTQTVDDVGTVTPAHVLGVRVAVTTLAPPGS
jgi:hypothetical protein